MTTESESARPGEDTTPNGGSLDSVAPVLIFLVLNSTVGLPWAIAGATAWSVKAAVSRSRRGVPIGKFLPLVTLAIVARGIVGIVTDSEAVYFGIGIAAKYAIGLALVGSVVIGRNLLARYAPLLFGFDEETQAHAAYRSGMNTVAIAVGVYYLVSASFDIWLFNNASVNGYVWIRFVVNWLAGMVTYVLAFVYLNRKLRVIPGFEGLMAMLEHRVESRLEKRST